MNEFDKWKFWLDANDHLRQCFAFFGIGLSMIALLPFVELNYFKIVFWTGIVFMFLASTMQLILGIREAIQDTKY